MKRYVEAKVKDSKLSKHSRSYILEYEQHGINCEILKRDTKYHLFRDFYTDSYKLCLEGNKEDIESYISYLRMIGFNVYEY